MMGFDLLVIMPSSDVIMLRHCLLYFVILRMSIELLIQDFFYGSVVIPANIMGYFTGFDKSLFAHSGGKG
jgi:hypothetical protein